MCYRKPIRVNGYADKTNNLNRSVNIILLKNDQCTIVLTFVVLTRVILKALNTSRNSCIFAQMLND